VFVLLSAVLQSVVPAIPAMGGVRLPLFCAIAVYYGLTHSRGYALAAAIAGGCLQDAMGLVPLGYSACWFCGFALVANWSRDKVFSESVITTAIFGASCAALSTFGTGMLLVTTGMLGRPVWWCVIKAGGAAVAGALVTPVMCGALVKVDRLVGNVRARREVVDGAYDFA